MQWRIQESDCGATQVIISQEQGDNTPTLINFPYDITGWDFVGTINFPTPIDLSIGSGLEVTNILSATGSIALNVLTISAIDYGTIYIGMPINAYAASPNTYVIAFGTGSGGIGTYIVNQNQTLASTTIVLGQLTMQLTSVQTQTVPEGQYPFDIWSIATSGINTDPVTGFFDINTALTIIS